MVYEDHSCVGRLAHDHSPLYHHRRDPWNPAHAWSIYHRPLHRPRRRLRQNTLFPIHGYHRDESEMQTLLHHHHQYWSQKCHLQTPSVPVPLYELPHKSHRVPYRVD